MSDLKCKFINPKKFDVTELGALMARTSRDHRGFDEIAKSVEHIPIWDRVETIMKWVSYGHASILDLMEVPLSFTGITMYQAARLFQFSPRGAGQEASTRYINNNPDWAATKDQKRIGGRLDNIRSAIPVNAKTSMVLRQSLRDWAHVLALCTHSCEADLKELHAEISNSFPDFLLTLEQRTFLWDYVEKCEDVATKSGSSFERRIGKLILSGAQLPWCEMVRAIDDTYIVQIVEPEIPFYIVRDLNRHRNRILTAWGTPVVYDSAPMADPVPVKLVMTAEQFLYEYGTRTTKEADEAYASLYRQWGEMLNIERMRATVG